MSARYSEGCDRWIEVEKSSFMSGCIASVLVMLLSHTAAHTSVLLPATQSILLISISLQFISV
jgi:hypothetical protein